ncbi:MAG: DUF975 family protein [Fibrobacterota bacterium]
MENSEITAESRRVLKQGNWGEAISLSALYGALFLIPALFLSREVPTVYNLYITLISGPLALGLCRYFLSLSRQRERSMNDLFYGFGFYLKAVVTQVVVSIFIMLWTMLLIIPGIIKSYAYAMTFFVLADDPSLSTFDAITKSRELMEGRKMELFFLTLRFFGWGLLALLTLGIGFLWLFPYVQLSMANFYRDARHEYDSSSPDVEFSPRDDGDVLVRSI